MENEISKIIETLAINLGIAANEIVPHYIVYYMVQSAAYILFGIVLVFVGLYLLRVHKTYEDKDDPGPIISMVGAVILFIIGSLFIVCNVGDMVKPQATAYHQIIKDMQPLKR